jgi:hypothetical protein
VEPSEFDQTQATRVTKTKAAIAALRAGGGKPPYLTTMHMRLGPIGLTFARLQHIIRERVAKGQDVQSALDGIAECMVHGDPRKEPPIKDNKRHTGPQIWATSGKHQVTLSPFWEEEGLPTDKVPTWVVTGYEMAGNRPEETREAAPVEIQIQNPNTAEKK